ncbi:MAG: hypothetical protein ACP6IU_12130 [Candidatus Asgardarchaeia archaeon]
MAVIIFIRRKVDELMSLAEVLTLEEKKKLIEILGIEAAIEAFGIKKVIDAVGLEKVIETVGLEKLIDTVGLDKLIEVAGLDKIIDALGRLLNLTDEEKRNLLMKYQQAKRKTKS